MFVDGKRSLLEFPLRNVCYVYCGPAFPAFPAFPASVDIEVKRMMQMKT